MNKMVLVAVCFGATAIPMAASAQSSVQFNYDGRPERLFQPGLSLSNHDRKALKDVAIANMFEMRLGELAASRGEGEWAQEFGKEMVHEHTFNMNELNLIADEKGIALPSSLPHKKQAILDHLDSLQGEDFDRAFRKAQIMAHRMTSTALKRHIEKGRDEDVKSFLVKTLPAVNLHLRLAQMEKTAMGPTKYENNS